MVSESAAAGTGDTLAVVPFRVYGEVPHPEMVSHGLPELISGHLSKVPGITVVDRIHLSEVIQELKLGQTGLVDEKTAAKTGTLLPANLVLAGTAQCSGKDIQIQIQAVRTSTGKIAFGVEAEGTVRGLGELAALGRLLSVRILGAINAGLGELDAAPDPTNSEPAFDDYSLGLFEMDAGRIVEATALFKSASDRDARFLWPVVVRERAERAFGELDKEVKKLENR